MTDVSKKLVFLRAVYDAHDEVIQAYDPACSNGCDVCCTRNVVITSLEACDIFDRCGEGLMGEVLGRIMAEIDRKRMIPRLTVNGMARLYAAGEEPPEEENDPAWGQCPLLVDGCCMIYDMRPFACRSMVSAENCRFSGLAEMDDFIVTLNNVFMQYLEHADQGGVSANMSDLLTVMDDPAVRESYRTNGRIPAGRSGLLMNEAIRVLMVPPEHRDRIQRILEDLRKTAG